MSDSNFASQFAKEHSGTITKREDKHDLNTLSIFASHRTVEALNGTMHGSSLEAGCHMMTGITTGKGRAILTTTSTR